LLASPGPVGNTLVFSGGNLVVDASYIGLNS
jgi:hypothetical protein